MVENLENGHAPFINPIKHLLQLGCSVSLLKELLNPFDEVVFESALYCLVKEVRGNQFMNVGAGKIRCKRLWIALIGYNC